MYPTRKDSSGLVDLHRVVDLVYRQHVFTRRGQGLVCIPRSSGVLAAGAKPGVSQVMQDSRTVSRERL